MPKAIEAKAGMGHFTASGFVNFMTELNVDYQKKGQITGSFLADWAVKHLDQNHFPAEIGIQEVAILMQIGTELLSIVCGTEPIF